MKKLLSRQLAFLLILTLVSCSKNNITPINEIEDASGLDLSLTWTLADGSNPFTTNLDLLLYQANDTTTIVDSSSQQADYEHMILANNLTDGDYTLSILHKSVSKNGSYTLAIKGVSVNKGYILYNIPFTLANDSLNKKVLDIQKKGNKFTFNKL